MAVLPSYLPNLSVYDPPESGEGTIDPLGVANLAGRIADMLVPGFTERVRRPRFLTMLALGAWVLSRPEYEGGTYGLHPDGPAYLAWERLVVESFARKGNHGDDELRGIPGIGKAREAAAHDARLSSRLHLKNPAAVGLWVGYKGLAAEVGVIDDHGSLGEAGSELLDAWARGIGEPERLKGDAEATCAIIDAALEPLLGTRASSTKPQRAWSLVHDWLHPGRLTREETAVIARLLRERDEQRGRVFACVEGRFGTGDDALAIDEQEVIKVLTEAEDPELARWARLARDYEALAGQITAAFECILTAGAAQADGRVSAESVLGSPEVGATFAAAPGRIREALRRAQPQLEECPEAELARRTLAWLDDATLASPGELFENLLDRHCETQRAKPPAGKRPWVEGEPGLRFVRRRFADRAEAPPEDGARVVHSYRTWPVRSCLRDLARVVS